MCVCDLSSSATVVVVVDVVVVEEFMDLTFWMEFYSVVGSVDGLS